MYFVYCVIKGEERKEARMATRFSGQTMMDGWWCHLNHSGYMKKKAVIYGVESEDLFVKVNFDMPPFPTSCRGILPTECKTIVEIKAANKDMGPKRKDFHIGH